MLFPNADAIVPKRPPNSSIVFGASVAPVKVPTAYFKIHPITTVYPIATSQENQELGSFLTLPQLFSFLSSHRPSQMHRLVPDLAARPKLSLSDHTSRCDHNDKDKIRDQKRTSPIQRYPCRKHPYTSHANCRTNAGEDKSPPAVK